MEKLRLKIEFLLLHHFFILVNLYEFRTRKNLCTLIEVYIMNDTGNNYDINSGNSRKISNFPIVK